MKRILLAIIVFVSFGYSGFSQGCVGSQTLTATPPPNAAGAYAPGTTVTYCYTLTDYAQNSADWLAGIYPILGPGWDSTSLIPISASPSCALQGNWAWYSSCTGTASGNTYGPGFYYDTDAGSTSGTIDGIPGNNFGDNCLTFTWSFCFQVTVSATAPQLTDLTVCVQPLSDYEAGSWGTDDCQDACFPLEAFVQVCTLFVPTVNVSNATCYNSNDGSISVTPSGVAPYTFLWSNGATTQNLTNVPAGIYTLTVTDSTLCNKTITVVVPGDSQIQLNPVVVNNGCTASVGGSVTLAPTGGSGTGFTYLWSDGSTSDSISNVSAGTYTVTVTDSHGCTQTDSYTIYDGIPITLTTTAVATGCTGNTGSATAIVTGGIAPITYSWSPTGGNGPVASNLSPGTYTVTVTDSIGCTQTSQAVVNSIGLFTLSTQFVPLTCDPLGTTTATVVVTGGTAPFTYQWTPFGGNLATATGLTAGNYTVLVTDSNSCVDSAFVSIPTVVPVQITFNTLPVQCNSANSGSATAVVTGGTAPYVYLWSDGTTNSSINNLSGGTYTVTVTDSQGCSSTSTTVVGVNPDVLISAGANQSICSGQSATITGTATGGTLPFTYIWSNGISTDVQTVNPTSTTTYTITVTDANGCVANSSVIIDVQNYPVVTVSPAANICFGTSTTLSAAGGATYSWSPSNGLNDTTLSNPVANPANSTTYTVTVSNGMCSSTATVDVNVAPEIIGGFSPDTTNGQAPLTVHFSNSSTGASTYEWSFGDGNTSVDSDPSHTYTQQGSYPVIMVATNSFGCNDTVRYSFIVVEELASLTVPNVFTPNADGLNDSFSFIEKGISSISVIILNRWGNEVYSWSKLNSGWDGKSKDGTELPEGVYLYVIKAQGINDKPYNFQGTVELIRNKK